jgi:tetratricopeptide (TPR) repeat protein
VVEALGDPYLHTGQVQKAIEYYQKALKYYEAQTLSAKVAQLRRKVGHAYQISWEFATAIPILEQALEEVGSETGREAGMLYLDLARAYNFTGQPERGMVLAHKALELAETGGATDELAMAHAELGVAHLHLMQMNDVERHNRDAIRLGEQTRSYLGKTAVMRGFNNLAVLEALRDNLQAHLDARKKSLELAEEMRDPFWIAWTSVNVGNASRGLGDWEAARTYYDRVLALGERAGTNLRDASSYRKRLDEDWEGFLEDRRADVAAAEKRRDVQAAFMGFWLMAEAAVMLGRYREAEEYARRGLDVKYPAPSWTWPGVLYILSESLARQGRLDEAAGACDQAETVVRGIGGTGAWGAIHYLRGIIEAARGHRDEAGRHFHEAIRIYEEFPHPYEQARIFEDLGALYASQDSAKASEAYAQALRIFERLGAQRSMSRIRKTT